MKKVYLSGPISGLEKEEYLARFAKAEEMVAAYGYRVVNPTKFWVCRWAWLYRIVGYVLTLLYDLWRLSRCDYIYKIPGWQQSTGANIESCWAYHFKIWPLEKKQRDKIDKRLEKMIKQQSKPKAEKKPKSKTNNL